MGIIRIFIKDSRQNKEFWGENAFFGYILSILGVFLEHIVSRDRGVIFSHPRDQQPTIYSEEMTRLVCLCPARPICILRHFHALIINLYRLGNPVLLILWHPAQINNKATHTALSNIPFLTPPYLVPDLHGDNFPDAELRCWGRGGSVQLYE